MEFGPVEASEKGKLAGFLDGSFSPDGTRIVLTDDNGSVTILDSAKAAGESDAATSPTWINEQYFANDYYELSYDTSGYCIERGSERPPHLAPRGVRCNHSGAPWSDEVNETYRKLVGPMPLPEQESRWIRNRARANASKKLEKRDITIKGQLAKIHRGVREFDPLSTILIKASGHVDDTAKYAKRQQAIERQAPSISERENSNSNRASNGSRNLSSNYRWRDYEDMMRDQPEDEMDSDDDEFEPTTSRNTSRIDEEEEDEMDLDELEAESPFRPNTRRQNVDSGERRQSRRRTQRSRNDQFVELGSDDEDVAQFMSTNNTPSGPFVKDYAITGHYWRHPGTGRVKRRWLFRYESHSSFEGRKIYTPQLGDSVVYIPRAHYETIKDMPSITPPWQNWPQGAAWPVVRCCIRGVRFRFPYEDYYGRG